MQLIHHLSSGVDSSSRLSLDPTVAQNTVMQAQMQSSHCSTSHINPLSSSKLTYKTHQESATRPDKWNHPNIIAQSQRQNPQEIPPHEKTSAKLINSIHLTNFNRDNINRSAQIGPNGQVNRHFLSTNKVIFTLLHNLCDSAITSIG